MTNLAPQDAELREMPDWTIAERIEHIEQALKRDPYVPYRRELEREYYALTTDPEERYERA